MASRETRPDLIILGRIATLGGTTGHGWVEGLAISGGRILAAGGADAIADMALPGTEVWRLASELAVMPSITDAHLHLLAAAASADEPDLDGLTIAGVATVIRSEHRRLASTGDHDSWIRGHGWSLDSLGTPPTHESLDGAAPGRAVALWSHDHHSRWLSSEAMRRAGLEDGAGPSDGRIVRDEVGRPSGWLLEGAASLVDAAIPGSTDDALEVALGSYARELARLGVTGAHDPGGLVPDPGLAAGPAFYRRQAQRGSLPMRIVASIREEQLERAIAVGFHSGREVDPSGQGRYRDGWIKLFADGALGSRTAHLSLPYEADDPARRDARPTSGMPLRDHGQLAAVVSRAATAGIASQIHAIGDAAVRTALDVLESAPRIRSVHHRVEHAQLVHPDDVPRFGRAGIAASVQACHLISDAATARRAWGARTAWAFPLAGIDAGGACLPLGTDGPVEPPDPWRGIAAAVTRQGASWPHGESFHPEQAITLDRVLRAACLDGPRSLGVADEGHLTGGARADLLVVPSELFRASADTTSISAIRPLATLLDGEVVTSSADFDP